METHTTKHQHRHKKRKKSKPKSDPTAVAPSPTQKPERSLVSSTPLARPNGHMLVTPTRTQTPAEPTTLSEPLLRRQTISKRETVGAPAAPVDPLKAIEDTINDPIPIQTKEDLSSIHPALQDGPDLPSDLLITLSQDIPVKLVQEALITHKDLCSFCDQELPDNPSQKLIDLGHYLKGRNDVQRRYHPRNPLALHLPVCFP
ncbi:hypothetical protein PGT21_034994 [Puccinia graminis f. sp. tritici]|uniref:Uncharacterized protein n=1 Tax=Puccinia graminis f. sp. tritici TaxID=56615 RepID=A0A5B0MFG6_PUCGR|nr:hypothetical protein PGT21_034994 [Puccinia graminis f. sp. tritici]